MRRHVSRFLFCEAVLNTCAIALYTLSVFDHNARMRLVCSTAHLALALYFKTMASWG